MGTHTHLNIYACACADDMLSVSVLARQAPQPASPATPASSSRLQVLKVCACEGERGGVWERKMLLTPLSVFDKKEAGPHAVSLPVPPVDWMTCVCIYMFVVVSLQKKKMHILSPYRQSVGTYLIHQRMDSFTNPSYTPPLYASNLPIIDVNSSKPTLCKTHTCSRTIGSSTNDRLLD